jgi:hypothetical protein
VLAVVAEGAVAEGEVPAAGAGLDARSACREGPGLLGSLGVPAGAGGEVPGAEAEGEVPAMEQRPGLVAARWPWKVARKPSLPFSAW